MNTQASRAEVSQSEACAVNPDSCKQSGMQANWARGRKVKPDQDRVYRSTGHPYASVQ